MYRGNFYYVNYKILVRDMMDPRIVSKRPSVCLHLPFTAVVKDMWVGKTIQGQAARLVDAVINPGISISVTLLSQGFSLPISQPLR